jgi:hypothetical protein
MGLVGIGAIVFPLALAYCGYELSCSNRILLVGPYFIAGLAAGYYFFSEVTLAIQAHIGPAQSVSIRAGGSAAFALIGGLAGYMLFPSKTCEIPRSFVRILNLPLSAEDVSDEHMFTKHFDGSRQRTMDYEFEIKSKASVDKNEEIDREDSVSGPIYKIYYNSPLETASNISRGLGTDHTDCFVSKEPPLNGKTIHSVKLTLNGAQLVDDDSIKAAAIK